MLSILSIIYEISFFIFLVYIFLSMLFGIFSSRDKYNHMIASKTTGSKDLFYCFIIPCFEEEAVIEHTLKNLVKFKFNGVIYVVDDASKDHTIQCAHKVADPRIQVLERKLPNAQKGKGDSLNFALTFLQREIKAQHIAEHNTIVGVIDADAALSKHAMTRLNDYFSDPSTAIAQLRVKMYPTFKNALQVSQDAEFFTINNYSQIMRMFTSTVGLSGNGQFFRLSVVAEQIGYAPWGNALLDDYELTIKCMLKQIKIEYLADIYVYQQSLASYKRYIRQRSRWVQGNLDCLKYVKAVVTAKNLVFKQKLGIMYFLLQPWINILVDIVILVLGVHLGSVLLGVLGSSKVITTAGILLILFAVSLVWGLIFTSLYVIDLRHFDEPVPKWTLLLRLPFLISYLYVVLFFSIVTAFWRQISNQKEWLKTQREE